MGRIGWSVIIVKGICYNKDVAEDRASSDNAI
jgi:hypothetical protein